MFNQLESKFVDAGGLRTHYVESGAGEPVVLIHGGGAGADGKSNFSGNLPIYSEYVRAIAVDMVGFGGTDKPSPDEFEYTQQTRTDHMIAFIEAMGLEKVNLVGNSMGGTTACGVAIQRPDLVNHLVLMGAAVNMTAEKMHENRPNLAAVMAYDDTREGMRRIIDALTYDYTPTDEYVDYRYKASIKPENKAAYKALMGWAGQNGLVFSDIELASLQMPVLIVAGKDDIMIPIERSYTLLQQIPHAWGTIFPKCGHWVMTEYPEEFCDVTLRFFGAKG